MRMNRFGILLLLLGIVALLMACTVGRSRQQPPESVSPPAVNERQAPSSQGIRSIDFTNFTFHWVGKLGDASKSFTLRKGKLDPTRNKTGMVEEMGVNLQSIAYGDATGDGVEDAMVVLSIVTGGSAIPHATYIFALENGKPKLLWALYTGDRADGGLRQVYAENGKLVIEQYSNPDPLGGECPACPTHFTRTRYAWKRNSFHQEGRKEVLPNPNPMAPASPIMPRYPL